MATDFLRPSFKGKLITGYPGLSDATLFAFATIVRKYGWGYMTQYMKQQPKFVEAHLDVARSLALGESLVSFDANVSSTIDVQHRAGGKIILAGPMDDLLPVSFSAEAILRDAPHPNAAKLFVRWFLSKEWQSRTGLYSSRSDVPPPADLSLLSSYRLEDRYLEFLTAENQLTDFRKRFQAYTGGGRSLTKVSVQRHGIGSCGRTEQTMLARSVQRQAQPVLCGGRNAASSHSRYRSGSTTVDGTYGWRVGVCS